MQHTRSLLSIVEDFNKNESNFELYINETIDVNTYYLMSNENLIYFSMILDKLGTDEVLLQMKTYIEVIDQQKI